MIIIVLLLIHIYRPPFRNVIDFHYLLLISSKQGALIIYSFKVKTINFYYKQFVFGNKINLLKAFNAFFEKKNIYLWQKVKSRAIKKNSSWPNSITKSYTDKVK